MSSELRALLREALEGRCASCCMDSPEDVDRTLDELMGVLGKYLKVPAKKGPRKGTETRQRMWVPLDDERLDIPIRLTGLCTRVKHAILNQNIRTLGELAQRRKCEMRKAKNLGKLGLREVENYLLGIGLDFHIHIGDPRTEE